MLEHYGTHLDAPIHFPPGKMTVDEIPARKLFGPAVVLDARPEGGKDADYPVPAALVEEWEKRHRLIPEGAIVLLRPGWAARSPAGQRDRYQEAQGRVPFTRCS